MSLVFLLNCSNKKVYSL